MRGCCGVGMVGQHWGLGPGWASVCPCLAAGLWEVMVPLWVTPWTLETPSVGVGWGGQVVAPSSPGLHLRGKERS